ncbi:DUF302 domain-containing protein [Rhodovulum sp. DZ06]|uniref:DUF302 domain-containing protein n=1 Tax=Rhodovulum sp. DZ06 TaxID=3425126 RepID=UPI003D354E50
MKPVLTAAAALLAAASPALAQEMQTSEHLKTWVLEDAAFDDVAFDLKLAVEGRGLVVDHISHVGEMLNRTAADVGATMQVYDHAQVIQFCSATVSRGVMEADPLNIAWCPYGIFLFQETGAEGVTVGFRRMPAGLESVEALLTGIIEEATGF